MLRHDQYSREVAGNAIRRYNDHIEACNRVIEAEETGLWQWTSSAELQELNEKVEVTQAEVKRLEGELETKATLIAEMSLRCPEPVAPNPDLSVHAKPIERINQLEQQIDHGREEKEPARERNGFGCS